MLQEFEEHLRRRFSPATVRLRIYWIEKYCAVHNPLDDSTDDLLDFIESGGWKPATRQTLVSSLRVYFAWLTKTGQLSVNPALDIGRVYVPRQSGRIAGDQTILNGIDKATLTEEAMLRLGAECGLRVAEIASLHRECREGEWLTVTGKGGRVRSVYLPPELLAILVEIECSRMRWGYYFPSKRPREHVAPSTIWRHVRALTGMNTHSLRHRAVNTVYREAGNDIRLAQEFAGHASPQTTAAYLHVERDDLRNAGTHARLSA